MTAMLALEGCAVFQVTGWRNEYDLGAPGTGDVNDTSQVQLEMLNYLISQVIVAVIGGRSDRVIEDLSLIHI